MVLFQEISKSGGRSVFARPSERVTKLLKATKLDRVLETADTLEKAIAALGA